MMPRPLIFISAVSKELRSARDLVAKTVYSLGYEPVWQDIFGTEQGDLREVLRKKIDDCQGVIQLVGYRYGAEPPVADDRFGRVSYTQYEALYARQQGKKVWYIIDITPPPIRPESSEPEDLRRLQDQYRKRIQAGADVYYEVDLKNDDAVKNAVHEIKNELARLRRSFRHWTASVTALLLLILGLVVWGLVKKPPSPINEMTEERANAAFIAKDYPAAFDAYARLSASNPTNIAFHRRAEESARFGLLKKPFLDHYLALVQQQPTNAIFYNYLGNAYLMIDPKDKDGNGQASYETAVRLDPQLAPPMANLGILNFRFGKTNEAEALFRRYLAAQPNDAQAWVNLGLLYLAKVQADTNNAAASISSEKALQQALQIDPSSFAAYKALGRLRLATNRKKDALDAYQRSLALNGDQPDVRELMGGEFRSFGTESDDIVTRGSQNGPTNLPSRPEGIMK
jgi:hypothetical protein